MSRTRGGLPDYLSPGLSILFVGINPSLRSSEVGRHFAGPSNRFWKLLFDAGLVPSRMTCHDDERLLDYGYGLTNLIAKPTAGVHDLEKQDFLNGRLILIEKIKKYKPGIVAVLGISVARVLLPEMASNSFSKQREGCSVQPGLQPLVLAGVRVFVLPNPSGRNAHYSYQHLKDLFGQLKDVSLQSP